MLINLAISHANRVPHVHSHGEVSMSFQDVFLIQVEVLPILIIDWFFHLVNEMRVDVDILKRMQQLLQVQR